MYGPDMAILLIYGSHDMRHTGFRRLTVVNGTPWKWGVTVDDQNVAENLCFAQTVQVAWLCH